uniref:Carboxylic ester hydrolase n=1 Tax=Megaselia scalaris TaxID=36166 RepID=T1GJI9_MEGSC
MKGVTLESQKGHTIYTFRGIPYAEPPIGPLRFKDPVPKSKWSGVLDATDDGFTCPQYEVLFKNLNQSEDCLILNVYSRNLNGNAPVMFYLHGGGHLFGTSNSNTLGPRFTGTEEATGNYLFKDVILALKWVRDNIKSFGGNPECVTVFGHSAGSLQTTTLLVSPLSRGLFHRAIGMGGSSTATHSLKSKYWTMKMAEDIGCGNEANVIECMRKVPWETIRAASNKWEEGSLITLRFNFEIEQDFGQEIYLSAHPNEYFENGDFERIPIMMSQTKNEFECLAAFVFYSEAFKPIIEQVNTDFEKIAPALYGAMHGDEVQYLFNFKEAGYIEPGSKDETIMDLMTGIFTRFAATGNPNEPGKEDMWKPSNSNGFSMAFIDIPDGNGNIQTGNKDPAEERYRIWDELFNL